MSNNKDFKVKNGVKPTVYHEGLGTVSVAGGVATLDLSTGSVFDYTPTSDVQVTLSNPAASGTVSGATLLLSGGAAVGYDIANAAYTGNSVVTSAQGCFIKDDGTKFYAVTTGNVVKQWSLSIPYDLSTATDDAVDFSVSGQSAGSQDIFFKSDGSSFYILSYTNIGIYQYILSTPWDISTASYASKTLDFSGQTSQPRGVQFKTDGTALYILEGLNDTVYQYTLSTAWDVSTGSYASKSFSVTTQASNPYGVALDSSGTKLFIVDNSTDSIYQYTLSTAWDISTASYASISLATDPDSGGISAGLVFSSDGKKLYYSGYTGSNYAAYEYNSATPATITYDSNIQWPSGTAPTSPPIGETDVITLNTRDGGTTYNAALAIDGAA